jgi:antitoxin ParD1/3/4
MSLNISLPAALESRVREQVSSGMYGSASEVVREALRFFEAYQSVQTASLAALKSDIAQGLQDAQAGRVSISDIEAIKSRGRAALKQNIPQA